MFKNLWIIRGEKAGTFEQVPDDEAQKMLDADEAQIVDGSPLRYPENHPHFGMDENPPKKARKKTAARKKYPNKAMTTDTDA